MMMSAALMWINDEIVQQPAYCGTCIMGSWKPYKTDIHFAIHLASYHSTCRESPYAKMIFLNRLHSFCYHTKKTSPKLFQLFDISNLQYSHTMTASIPQCISLLKKANLVAIVIWFRDDVMKWKHFLRNWPFVREIHQFPAQRPVTRSFDVFIDLRLNERLSKQSWAWWFETLSRPLWRHCNVMVQSSAISAKYRSRFTLLSPHILNASVIRNILANFWHFITMLTWILNL